MLVGEDQDHKNVIRHLVSSCYMHSVRHALLFYSAHDARCTNTDICGIFLVKRLYVLQTGSQDHGSCSCRREHNRKKKDEQPSPDLRLQKQILQFADTVIISSLRRDRHYGRVPPQSRNIQYVVGQYASTNKSKWPR